MLMRGPEGDTLMGARALKSHCDGPGLVGRDLDCGGPKRWIGQVAHCIEK